MLFVPEADELDPWVCRSSVVESKLDKVEAHANSCDRPDTPVSLAADEFALVLKFWRMAATS